MTTTTYNAETKIMMQFFNLPLSGFDALVKLHGGVKEAHAHLAKLFDERKAIQN